jgi:hypothetical protein
MRSDRKKEFLAFPTPYRPLYTPGTLGNPA